MTTQTRVPPDAFGVRLFRLRRALGLSAVEIAERAGVPHRSWSRWENGDVLPRNLPVVARQIAEATEVDLLWLLYGDADGVGPGSQNSVEFVTYHTDERLVGAAA